MITYFCFCHNCKTELIDSFPGESSTATEIENPEIYQELTEDCLCPNCLTDEYLEEL